MNVLICNVGSTSLKSQLFRMPEELVAASGGAERVGTDAGRFYAKTQENGALVDEAAVFPTHREAIERMLLQLQQLGVDVPASAYTVEQAADLLAPLLKGGRPTC